MIIQPQDGRGSYAFGRFRLSADGTLLLRDREPVPLAPKVLRTLHVLVDRAGAVVRKDDLMRAVWGDVAVEDTGLTRNISLLRHALGDVDQALIVTVPRVGYRFAGAVGRHTDGPAAATAADAGAAGRDRRPRRLMVMPFRLLSADLECDFLGFSLPDAVVTALAALPELVVRSSAVAAGFARQPLDFTVLAADAIDGVVTGTIARAADRVQVSAQLIDVSTGIVHWSETLQQPVHDLFALQERLVTGLVAALSLAPTASERRRLRGDRPANPTAYECYLRANEAIGPQGITNAGNLRVARALYRQALEEDPAYAPAWARLGRCHYLLGKLDEPGDDRANCLAEADRCFRQALVLSPELPAAHGLAALVEIERGQARDAMARLIGRWRAGHAGPELLVALIQACRYAGLLEPSIAAHYRARQLDPGVPTSGYQSLWQLGDEEGALREGIRPYLLRAIVTGMRGHVDRAVEQLQDLETRAPTSLIRGLSACIRGVFEGQPEVTLEHARRIWQTSPDPEYWVFVSRAVASFGDPAVLRVWMRALDSGYVVYRVLLRADPWVDPVRSCGEFAAVLDRARDAYRASIAAYRAAGGDELLGPVPEPEELERAGS